MEQDWTTSCHEMSMVRIVPSSTPEDFAHLEFNRERSCDACHKLLHKDMKTFERRVANAVRDHSTDG